MNDGGGADVPDHVDPRCESAPAAPAAPAVAATPTPMVIWVNDGPVCVSIVTSQPTYVPGGVCRCGACRSAAPDPAAPYFPD